MRSVRRALRQVILPVNGGKDGLGDPFAKVTLLLRMDVVGVAAVAGGDQIGVFIRFAGFELRFTHVGEVVVVAVVTVVARELHHVERELRIAEQSAPVGLKVNKMRLIINALAGVVAALVPHHAADLRRAERVDHAVVMLAARITLPTGDVGVALSGVNDTHGHRVVGKTLAEHRAHHKRHGGIILVLIVGRVGLEPERVLGGESRRRGDVFRLIVVTHAVCDRVVDVRRPVGGSVRDGALGKRPLHVGLTADQIDVADQHVFQNELFILQKFKGDVCGSGVCFLRRKGEGEHTRACVGYGVLPFAIEVDGNEGAWRRHTHDVDCLAPLNDHMRFKGFRQSEGCLVEINFAGAGHRFKRKFTIAIAGQTGDAKGISRVVSKVSDKFKVRACNGDVFNGRAVLRLQDNPEAGVVVGIGPVEHGVQNRLVLHLALHGDGVAADDRAPLCVQSDGAVVQLCLEPLRAVRRLIVFIKVPSGKFVVRLLRNGQNDGFDQRRADRSVRNGTAALGVEAERDALFRPFGVNGDGAVRDLCLQAVHGDCRLVAFFKEPTAEVEAISPCGRQRVRRIRLDGRVLHRIAALCVKMNGQACGHRRGSSIPLGVNGDCAVLQFFLQPGYRRLGLKVFIHKPSLENEAFSGGRR